VGGIRIIFSKNNALALMLYLEAIINRKGASLGITYKKAGVDIAEGERLVDLIKPAARRTLRPEVMKGIGLFGALFRLDLEKYKEPVLASATDGVGTKLRVAFMADRHDTVGIDLVAMSVNDILTLGAEPLFFLDYFATGKLKAQKAAKVIEGIAEGCREAGCALIGGETAEMPGFYAPGEYDLAGFAVGIVEREETVDGSAITKGDAVVGLSSSGLHSNGYSLARKVLLEKEGLQLKRRLPALGCTLAEELLRPTRIYVRAFRALKGKVAVKGMAHITGGGIPGNLNRILKKNLSAVVDESAWERPPIFDLIQRLGDVPADDMKKTFNMGIGYAVVVSSAQADRAVSLLQKAGYDSSIIGSIEKGTGTVRYR
jgi:phosphoribosylformylglycinamidine cyclo-ligase